MAYQNAEAAHVVRPLTFLGITAACKKSQWLTDTALAQRWQHPQGMRRLGNLRGQHKGDAPDQLLS